MQILSEAGVVGTILYLLIIGNFVCRTRLQKQRAASAIWTARGGLGDLRALARGLESGMVGYLGTNMFHNQLYTPWLALLVGMNGALSASVAALPGRPERWMSQ
jgi:hypothetical protein